MKKFLALLLTSLLLVAMFAVPASADSVKLTPVSFEIVSGDGNPATDARNGNLIDGQLGTGVGDGFYDTGLWYAFKDKNVDTDDGGSKVGTIVLDLGAVTEVTEVRVHHFGQTPDGVCTPWGMVFYYSQDGETWESGVNYVDTGSVQANSTVTCVETGTVYNTGENPPVWTASTNTYWSSLVDTHNARYVKVEVKFLGSAPWGFLSEIEVYGTATESSTPETSDPDDDNKDETSQAPIVSTPDESKDETPSTPNTGDSSSMIMFAVIALVAMAGSAVVIKNRK